MSLDVFDHAVVRCPQLGGQVSFGYCRVLEDGLPCRRALVCHERGFPVETFFRAILTDQTFRRCFERRPTDRLGRLLTEVDAARRRTGR